MVLVKKIIVSLIKAEINSQQFTSSNIVFWFSLVFSFQVEIVMGLEEEFGITVEEESAQSIATVQDAADLIEKLCEKTA